MTFLFIFVIGFIPVAFIGPVYGRMVKRQVTIQEIADFANFVLKKYEEQILQKGIETVVSESNSFAFLHDEEDLYDESDLKEKY